MVGREMMMMLSRWRLEGPLRKWLVRTTLAASLLGNLAFVVKVVVFDPNLPFRPICFANKWDGFIYLEGPLNPDFIKEMHYSRGDSRIERKPGISNATLYISRWDFWRDGKSDGIINLVRSVAEHVYEQKELGGRRITFEEAEKLKTPYCSFIRKYALEAKQP
jgi:hypothetical protein